jgi:hypothetical protein
VKTPTPISDGCAIMVRSGDSANPISYRCVVPIEDARRIEQQLTAALASNRAMADWILVTDRLPDFDDVVWLHEPGRGTWIGSRSFDGDGWLWANSYGQFWRGDSKWEADAETDDDYKPTHWRPLPEPPRIDAARHTGDGAGKEEK